MESMTAPSRPTVELIADEQHYEKVVRKGILRASASLAIATADFKAMLLPDAAAAGRRGRTPAASIVEHLAELAERGVEIRLLHAGVPSIPALKELKRGVPRNLRIRRCPRLHAKAIIVDCRAMYLGSANLTGAGLGAKHADKRNIEWGLWTTSTDLIDSVLARFDALWEGARCTTCRRKEVCPVPLEEPHL